MHRFSTEQQSEMKRDAEASWAADGYIVLSNAGEQSVTLNEFKRSERKVLPKWKTGPCAQQCCTL